LTEDFLSAQPIISRLLSPHASDQSKIDDARFKTAAVGTPLMEFEPRGGVARAGAAP
jgi:hypothetical protein